MSSSLSGCLYALVHSCELPPFVSFGVAYLVASKVCKAEQTRKALYPVSVAHLGMLALLNAQSPLSGCERGFGEQLALCRGCACQIEFQLDASIPVFSGTTVGAAHGARPHLGGQGYAIFRECAL